MMSLRDEEKNLQRLLAEAREQLRLAEQAIEPLRDKVSMLKSQLDHTQRQIIGEIRQKVGVA